MCVWYATDAGVEGRDVDSRMKRREIKDWCGSAEGSLGAIA